MRSTLLFPLLAVILLLSPSCENLRSFYNSPGGKIVISAGGVYIVSQSVQARPDIIPVLEALADTQEGLPVDVTDFDEPLLGLGVQVLGALTAHYGDDAAPALISKTIRQGIIIGSMEHNDGRGSK